MKYKANTYVTLLFNTIVKVNEWKVTHLLTGKKRLYFEGEILGLPNQKCIKASDSHIDFKSHCFIKKTAQFRLSGI